MADLVEVELEDELEPLPESPRAPRGPWSLRRWAWTASGLAVLLAATTVATGLGAASLSTASPGGLTTDLTVPRHASWTEPGAQLVGAAGDLVLVSDAYGQGVRALTATDGTQVWQSDGTCALASPAGYSTVQIIGGTPVLADLAGARVVCTDQGAAEPATRLLDAATGAVLAEAPQDSTVIGGYLVHVGSAATQDGNQEQRTITVRSLVDGAALWTRDLDPSDSSADWGSTPSTLVRIEGSAMTEVDLATGRMSPVPEGALVPLIELPLADGLTATSGWRASGQLTLVVTDALGQELWSRDGHVAVPAIVQGPSSGAMVLSLGVAGGLTASDAATGTALWSDNTDTGVPLVHVGGVVLVGTAAPELLDEQTGEVRWTVPDGEVVLSASDGTTLLLRDRATGDLMVRDLLDGREVTRYPLPGVRQDAYVQDAVALARGRLAVVTTDGLTILVP